MQFNRKEYEQQYYVKNKERILEYHQQYYVKNKERIIAEQSLYRKKHSKRTKEYMRKYYIKNRKHKLLAACKYRKNNSKQTNKKIAEWRLKVKLEVFDNYGGRKCCLCGECRIGTLQVDHVDGNGLNHRKSIGDLGGGVFLQWLRKNNFPLGFRILCANCNRKEHLARMRSVWAPRLPYRIKLKTTIMNKLGGKCICCGKTDIDILTIHHVCRNGAAHRRAYANNELVYRGIINDNNYDGLECRCYSCNCNEEWEYRKATATSWKS